MPPAACSRCNDPRKEDAPVSAARHDPLRVEDAGGARACLAELEDFLGRVDPDDSLSPLGRFDANAAIADAELDRGPVRFHEALHVELLIFPRDGSALRPGVVDVGEGVVRHGIGHFSLTFLG